MGHGIGKFLASKATTTKELDANFVLEKKMEKDAIHTKGCLNCGDNNNQYKYPAESWTSVTHCVACDRIILVYYSDRMGGNFLDSVMVYKEKEV